MIYFTSAAEIEVGADDRPLELPMPVRAAVARSQRHATVMAPTAAAGLVLAGLGATLEGWDGLVGALAGTLLVLAFAAAGHAVQRRSASLPPVTVFGVVMLSYLVKVTLLAAVVVAFRDTALFDNRLFAAAVLACTLVWLAAELRAFTKAKILYVDPHGGS